MVQLSRRLITPAIICIFLISAFMRFWLFTSYPVSLTVDEVSIGYGAYSLLQTGRDEWGQLLPLVFYSLGDYKPPVNYYLLVPSIALFSLNEFSVRLPVAFLGTVTSMVFIIFLRRLRLPLSAAIFGGFWLAVLPWHVHFSRYGLETVTALFFTFAGTALFLGSIRKKSHLDLSLAIICFSLAVWAYHSQRLFIPLLAIFLFLKFRSSLAFALKPLVKTFTHLLILAVFALPFIHLAVFTPGVRTRAASTSILRDPFLLPTLHQGNYTGLAQRLFDHDFYLIFHHWVGKYVDYFDFRFWFWKGLNFTPPGYPDLGLVYLVDLPLFIAGIFFLARCRHQPLFNLTVFWFLAGPLAASLTMNDQHTLRALVWLPFFGITVSAGATLLFNRARFWLVYLPLLLLSVAYFWDIYLIQYPKYYAETRHWGYKQAAEYACTHASEYDRIIISPEFGSLGPLFRGVPDYYVLFHCLYPPSDYLVSKTIPKFDFIKVDWRREREMKLNSLLIAPKWDFPELTPPAEYVINRLDYPLTETPAFYFVETRTGK